MQWPEAVEFLGGVAVIAGTIAYLGKKSIEAYLAGRVEAYKKNLEKAATEHSIRFQQLHTERARAIRDFYAKLALLDGTLHSSLRRFQPVEEDGLKEKVDQLAMQFNDLRTHFTPRRIFFDEKVCTLIDRILESARGIFFDITTYPVDPEHHDYKYDPALLKERHEFWQKARDVHAGEISKLKKQLEDEFRVMLGIGTLPRG